MRLLIIEDEPHLREQLQQYLQQQGFAAAAYHAGLPADVRRDVQERFLRDDIAIVVATVGFGGHRMADKFLKILEAQMAVGDSRFSGSPSTPWRI